jgi:hypothetical protein
MTIATGVKQSPLKNPGNKKSANQLRAFELLFKKID